MTEEPSSSPTTNKLAVTRLELAGDRTGWTTDRTLWVALQWLSMGFILLAVGLIGALFPGILCVLFIWL